MKPYYEHAGITIYHGDCRDIVGGLAAPDVVFTSPPYLDRRNYEMDSFDWHDVVPPALASIPDHGKTQILVNLGQCHVDGRLSRYWIELADAMEQSGWRWFGLYPWDQGSGLPGTWHGRFAASHELILHFNRNPSSVIKTIKKDPKSRAMGKDIRKADGKHPQPSSICHDSRKVADSVIRINRHRGYNKTNHPAIFPIALPKFIISAFPGETILDPFMGSGTTLRAAKDLGRKAIGIEIEEKYCEIAANRLAQEVLL